MNNILPSHWDSQMHACYTDWCKEPLEKRAKKTTREIKTHNGNKNSTDLGLWPAAPLNSGHLPPQSPGTWTSCFQDFQQWRSGSYHKPTSILSDALSPSVSRPRPHPPMSGWAACCSVPAHPGGRRRTAETPFYQAWASILRGSKEEVFNLFISSTDFYHLLSLAFKIRRNKICIRPSCNEAKKQNKISSILTRRSRGDLFLLTLKTSNIVWYETHRQSASQVLTSFCLDLSIADYSNVRAAFTYGWLPDVETDRILLTWMSNVKIRNVQTVLWVKTWKREVYRTCLGSDYGAEVRDESVCDSLTC